MINYKVCLNNGIEAFGVSQKTVTANEDVKTCGDTPDPTPTPTPDPGGDEG